MRNLNLIFALLICAGYGALSAAEPLVTLRTQTASFAIDAKGCLCGLSRNEDGRDYLAAAQPAPILSVRMEAKLYAPQIATWDAATRHLALRYGDTGASAVLKVESKPTHVVFELVEVQPTNRVELVVWGPYPTTIGSIIGETVGVVWPATIRLFQ